MAKIILFVDALEPREYGKDWIKTERGYVESGYPKVTPKVTSEVYTGKTPSENGMGAAHSWSDFTPDRPQIPTIQEKLEMAGYNVASLFMPYALPLNLNNGAWISTSRQQRGGGQNPITQFCNQPPVNGNLADGDADWDAIYNAKREDIFAKSSAMLNTIDTGGFEVVFLAIRTPDQYTHFQWHEDYRQMIIEDIGNEIARWEVNHDILWWSDHGSEEKKDVFRVNKWLIEKGYLDLEIDMEFIERFENEMENMQPEDQNNSPSVENQIGVEQPGVEIKPNSQAISLDPYDSCIDIIGDDVDVDELIEELRSTVAYAGVKRTEDRWGDGEYIDDCPDIVTLRDNHVLVTSNVHPEPIGMGFLRSGVHSKAGAWGTTDTSFEREGDVTPIELHDVIWEFVTGESQVKQEVNQAIESMQQQMEQQQNLLENLNNE